MFDVLCRKKNKKSLIKRLDKCQALLYNSLVSERAKGKNKMAKFITVTAVCRRCKCTFKMRIGVKDFERVTKGQTGDPKDFLIISECQPCEQAHYNDDGFSSYDGEAEERKIRKAWKK